MVAQGKKELEFISKSKFEEIASKREVEQKEDLLKSLHALGICLWYEKLKEIDTLVLDPEWISNGVYKMINWANNHNRYSIQIKDFPRIFKDELDRYPDEKSYYFLFKLLKYYELAYQPTQSQRLLLPKLMKEDRPEELPTFEIGESLKIQYKSDHRLPPDTISRFIVNHYSQIHQNVVWRHGVVLENGNGCIALVREIDRVISIAVKGPSMTEYISELRSTMNEILESYKSQKPELQYLGSAVWSNASCLKSI